MGSHFHVFPFDHQFPGDNGACRCAEHAGRGLPRMDVCTLGCHMCERTALIESRIAERGDGRALPGEEKARKAQKIAADLVRGGCGCGNYAMSALKAFDKAGIARPRLVTRAEVLCNA